jgi:drug/metabolite transporter (DMT)-like permease
MPWWDWVCRLLVIAGIAIEVLGRDGLSLWIGVGAVLLACVIYVTMLMRIRRLPKEK